MCTSTYVHTCTCTHRHICTHTYSAHTHTHMHTHCTCTYIHKCAYACMHEVHTHMCTHTECWLKRSPVSPQTPGQRDRDNLSSQLSVSTVPSSEFPSLRMLSAILHPGQGLSATSPGTARILLHSAKAQHPRATVAPATPEHGT